MFAMGVERLNAEHDEQELNARINAVCAEVDTSVDPRIMAYQRECLWAREE